jgi:IclR family KDG regulon transcriptional repressor
MRPFDGSLLSMGTTKNLSAVSRTFTILEKLSLVASSSLEELSKASGLAKPTVYRFLLTLRDLGYVHRDEGDKWFLTMKLFGMGSRALDHMELPLVARPIALKLSQELGETVHMGILDEGEVLYVLKIESRYTIRMYSRVGKKIPLYCSAMGKTLLAHADIPERESLLSSIKLVPFTPNTIKDRTRLEKALDKILDEGIAEDAQEHEEGITCLAAPVKDHTGGVVAALSASWPVFRFDQSLKRAYIQQIKKAADEISAILGYHRDNYS